MVFKKYLRQTPGGAPPPETFRRVQEDGSLRLLETGIDARLLETA